MNPKHIIKELENLYNKDFIKIDQSLDYTEEFNYEPIKHYLKSIAEFSTKPESASHELFKILVKDVLRIEVFSEVSVRGGFVDFAIKESVGNPILIELKPLFKFVKGKGILKPDQLNYNDHEEQILKYLRDNEYVILTNLKETFIFSRNAKIDFEPFKVFSFAELLHNFLQYQNLWDTIRRIEDQNIKIDLDRSFFEDLKNWYNEFKQVDFVDNQRFSKDELIVLLLNKIIFIKTLDDLGLIHFNQIVDEYLDKKEKWGAKGSIKILTRFFDEIEEYFDDFYDTELFKERFWDFVVKEKKNTDIFMNVFETSLGLDKWNRAFGRGMLHYNYRWIDEDIFGKAYETFIAENRKDSGIFYTSKEITHFMAEKTVDYLFNPIAQEILEAVDKNSINLEKANLLMEDLYLIKIVDTASGSGSFLIKTLRAIFSFYMQIEQKTAWIENVTGDNLFDQPQNYQDTKSFRQKHFLGINNSARLQLISKIILRHLFAVDIDERALETAKTNIWKEAIKLNPKIYNYRNLNGENNHILPNLELNFICGDAIADLPISTQLEIIQTEFSSEIILLHKIREEYISNPFHPVRIDEAVQIKKKIFERLHKELPEIEKSVFAVLDFYFCYFDKDGKTLPESEQGFYGAIGNPPWEAIKPIEKEFAGKSKGELDVLLFKEWFANELKQNKKFAQDWEQYKEFYERYKSIISNRYVNQGVGDPNYYKLFLERDLELLRNGGILNLLVPSGIQTDKGCSELRNLLIRQNSLHELLSFENRGYIRTVNGEEKTVHIFPEVDSRFKFTIVRATKLPFHPFSAFDAKFYMQDPQELDQRESIRYDLGMVEKFSPENLSIMEFKTEKDYQLCKKIRSSHKLFGECGYQLHAELHMTNDSDLFHLHDEIKKKKDEKKALPLFEGKMIHQFNSAFDEPRYFIYEKEAKEQLLATELRNIKRAFNLDDKQVAKLKPTLEYENYRFVYRAIGRSTDERTLIATIIPAKVFIGHSMNYLRNYSYGLEKNLVKQIKIPLDDLIVIMSLFNSLTLNYYIRNKISANLTMNFIYELPFPEITNDQKKYIVNAGITLLNHFDEDKLFKKLNEEVGFKPKTKIDSIKIRAELELYIAKEIFKLTNEDWRYLTSTFTYGGETNTRKELTEIIDYSLKV